MSFDQYKRNTQKWIKGESNLKLAIGGALILFAVYVASGMGYGREYQMKVSEEMLLAKGVCENSLETVLKDPKRLKLGQGDLRDVKVDGKKVKLKHVRFPKVVFMDSGIHNLTHTKTSQDIYCVISDPRATSSKLYYKYNTREWTNKVRFRR